MVASMQSGGMPAGPSLRQQPPPDCATGRPELPGDGGLGLGIPSRRCSTQPSEALTEESAAGACCGSPRSACPIAGSALGGPLQRHSLRRSVRTASKWRAGIMDRLRAERPALVVVSSARGYGNDGLGIWGQAGFDHFDTGWVGGLGRFTAEMRALGSQVLVVGPTPGSAGLVPVCLSAHVDNPRSELMPDTPVRDPAGIARDDGRRWRGGGGQCANATQLVCSARQVPVVVGSAKVPPRLRAPVAAITRLTAGPGDGALKPIALWPAPDGVYRRRPRATARTGLHGLAGFAVGSEPGNTGARPRRWHRHGYPRSH